MDKEKNNFEITQELLDQVATWDADYNPVGWICVQLRKTYPNITDKITEELVLKSRFKIRQHNIDKASKQEK